MEHIPTVASLACILGLAIVSYYTMRLRINAAGMDRRLKIVEAAYLQNLTSVSHQHGEPAGCTASPPSTSLPAYVFWNSRYIVGHAYELLISRH